MTNFVKLEIDAGVARMTLDRAPKRNALSGELMRDLAEAVATVAGEPSIRLLQLAAAGPVFCAGMDLGEMQQRAALAHDDAEAAWLQDADRFRHVVLSLMELPMPTIAVVQGPAVAGGLGLVLACDLVLASDSAWFELPEPKRGLVAAMVTPLLVHRVGTSLASKLLLGLRRVEASEAAAFGLCHAVVPEDELPATADEWSAGILDGAAGALAATKRFLGETQGGFARITDTLKLASVVSADARATDEARNGLAAFQEKREPDWSR